VHQHFVALCLLANDFVSSFSMSYTRVSELPSEVLGHVADAIQLCTLGFTEDTTN